MTRVELFSFFFLLLNSAFAGNFEKKRQDTLGVGLIAGVKSLEFSSSHQRSPSSEWQLTDDRDGIKVYKRSLTGTGLLSFRGVGQVDAPFAKVVQIVMDLHRAKEWAERFKEGRILRWIDKPISGIRYSEVAMPPLVKNRDFISLSTVSLNREEQYLRVDFSSTPEYTKPIKEGNILGDIGGSYFIVHALDGGKRAQLDGVAVIDLKGSIPVWVVNFFQSRWPYKTIVNIREQAKKNDIEINPDFDFSKALNLP